MIKKLRYFLSLMLVLILPLILLTACGGDAEEEATEQPTAAVATATEPAPVEAEEEPAEEAVEPEPAEAEEEVAEAEEATEPEPVEAEEEAAPAEAEGDTWLVMLYQDADDEILEQDIFIDLNEAEMIGSTDQVMVVAQLDRHEGAFDGDGDWTTAKRFLITQDGDLETIASEEIEDLDEVNMGSKEALVDFATWAIQTYPAQKYALILSDHGAGWTGGWNDNAPVEGSSLRMQDIDEALGEIIGNTGIDMFELVGFDACLMGQLEVFSAIAPHARYTVGSEETEPSLGWAYSAILAEMNNNPAMTGGELGQVIVNSYINQDGRITDDAARSDFVLNNFGFEGEVSAEEVAEGMSNDITLTAMDLSAAPAINAAMNDLVMALTTIDQSAVAEARAYAQSYTSIFGDDVPPSYIDLGHFLALLSEESGDQAVSDAAQAVFDTMSQAILAEKHGPQKPGSTGLTIYFPNSGLYEATANPDAMAKYTDYIGRFAAASLWDDFLAFHYTGKEVNPEVADLTVLEPQQAAMVDFSEAAAQSMPETDAEIASPGAGEISMTPITLSADTINVNDSVTLSTEITGDNISYIYYYVSYYDAESESFLTADMGYISSEQTKQVGGIYYPDWGDEPVLTMDFDWSPTVYFMSDGDQANDQFAFFEPEVYGATEDGDIYSVRGTFTYAKDGVEKDAIMKFGGDGKMQSVFGFNDAGGTGAPREITPRPGDQFTITEEWLDFDTDPEGEFVDYVGGTMTFGQKPFEMAAYNAFAGDYIVGFIVEDMNGNTYEEFASITVTEE